MTKFIGHFACISGACSSSDAMAVSEDKEGVYFGHCFSCGDNFTHNMLARRVPELELEFIDWNKKEYEELYTDMGDKITQEQVTWITENTTLKGEGFRGIADYVLEFYRVRTEYEKNEVVKRYYPATEDYKISGYKVRVVEDKDFYPVGKVGKTCDLMGQFKFRQTPKIVLITGGEEDALAAYEMLHDSTPKEDGKLKYALPAVVSPLIGENCRAQLQHNYGWLDKADKIILCFDNDEAGKKATEEAAKVLPKGKVFVMDQPTKDPNEALQKGLAKEWVQAYWRNHSYVPFGITSSDNLEDKMLEYLSMERISLPPFMHKMQSMLRGGFPLGYIINILSASGTGKSTFADAMILHWIMNNPYIVGIVSLEASEGEYAVNLSSSYCSFKINLLESVAERKEWLSRPENMEKRKELWTTPEGKPRFYLVDADIANLQKKIEYLVKVVGCKIIVLDPLQDVFDSLEQEDQAKFMKWQKDMVKEHSMNFVNINHSRKSLAGAKANSQGASLSEEDMHGHSSIFKSGGINIILGRNKEAEDVVERNTTYAKITKARGVGNTGPAGAYYYDNTTHTLHDRDDYFTKNSNIINSGGYEIEM